VVAKRRLERSCFLFTEWANAALEMLLDNAVAFTADLFQRCPLENRHVPPIVLQHAGLLKRTGDKADGRAVHSQHVSQEFLGEIKVVRPSSGHASSISSGQTAPRCCKSDCRNICALKRYSKNCETS
jgi:hypothetical protein